MKKTPPHIPKPKNSAGRDLKVAIPVGIGLFTIVLLAIFVIPFGWYPLVALAIFSGQWEVITRVTEAGYVVQRWCLLFGGQLMLWLSWPFGTTGLVSGFVAAVLCRASRRTTQPAATAGRHRPWDTCPAKSAGRAGEAGTAGAEKLCARHFHGSVYTDMDSPVRQFRRHDEFAARA